MTAPYLDALSATMQKSFPEPNPLWDVTKGNTLSEGWLLATPTGVWGTTYSDFAQAVPGTYADFDLAECVQPTAAGGTGTQRCATIGSTVTTAVGGTPSNLEVGHSSAMYEAIYETMISAEKLLDITTLTAPNGRFLAAFRNAITYLSTKADGQRPVVRVLYGRPWGPEQNHYAQAQLKTIIRDIAATAKLEVYLACVANTRDSWNHSKIVAADGERVLAGGHNMWGSHYLGVNPVFDVSMRLQGPAARAAHDYVEFLWASVPQLSSPTAPLWSLGRYRAARQLDSSGHATITDKMPPADLYETAKASFQTPTATGSAAVMGVGRRSSSPAEVLQPRFPNLYGAPSPEADVADSAIGQLLDLAKKTIRLSLQSLVFGPGTHMTLPLGRDPRVLAALQSVWPLQAMARAVRRGVDVYVVLSNPGAVAGGLGRTEAPYGGIGPGTANAMMLRALQELGMTSAEAKGAIASRFHAAVFRYSADETYPKGVEISNHAKTLIVDDAVFYVGSQNLYNSNLNEFGFIVEDAAAASDYMQQYWNPLWQYSKATTVSTYASFAPEDQVRQKAEAMQFLIALRKNRRLSDAWSDAVAARRKGAPGDGASAWSQTAYKSQTAEILDRLVVGAGFFTTSSVVAATSKLPFFGNTGTSTNDESDRFVSDLATKKDLMTAFIVVINKPQEAASKADAALRAFLNTQDYDCTPDQVHASLENLRRRTMSLWTGFYSDGWIIADNGRYFGTSTATDSNASEVTMRTASAVTQPTAVLPAPAPTLTVYENTGAALGKDELISPGFANGVLSWESGDGLLDNSTSGSLTFSEVTRPSPGDPYVGPECYGTVTYPDGGSSPLSGTYSYYARRVGPAPTDLPPAVDPKKVTNIGVYIGAVIAGVAVVAAIGVGVYLKKRNAPGDDDYQRLDDFVAREKRAPDAEPAASAESSKIELLEMQVSEGTITSREGTTLRRRVVRQQREYEEEAETDYAKNTEDLDADVEVVDW